MKTSARFFDGRTARPTPVVVSLHPRGMAIAGADGAGVAVWRYETLALAEPWRRGGGPARFIDGEGDARLVVEDAAFIEAALERAPHLRGGRDRDLRPRLIAGILFGVAAFGLAAYLTVDRAAPALAKAFISVEQARALGAGTEAFLVGGGPGAYCRTPEARAALDALTARLLDAAGAPADAVSVDIANIDMVNAFALPGGRVLLLRGLIEEAESAAEVAGVLAHEIGHAIERHPIEGVGRAFGAQIALILIAPGGGLDLAGAAALTSYTRAAEREADDWALRMLEAANIDARPLGAFFRRLAGGRTEVEDDGPLAWLSTHPDSVARAALFTRPGEPALPDDAWAALKAACDDAPEGRQPFLGLFGDDD